MFKPVPPKPNTAQMEDLLTRFWKTWRVRERCEEERRGGGEYVYFEQLPSPGSKPGFSHIAARAFNDLFLRYKTMRGYHVLRRSGWQAHGLPVELLAMHQLGMTGKSQIEETGIANFNQTCHNTLDYYAPYWERMNDRLGYWVNPQEAYLTLTNEYIESVWWAVKSLWDKGLLYQALKVEPYCPSCGIHLLKNEIVENDEDINEPLICVRLPLVNGPGTSLLLSTKDPWSLVGNVAVAVHPEVEYVTIEQEAPGGGLEHLVVAGKAVRKIFGDGQLKVVDKFKGKKLKGEAYFPLYTFLLPDKTAHFVIVDEFVREDIGTGLVHIAPAFDEKDLSIAQEHDLPLFNPVTDSGAFVPEVRPWSGKFVKDANPYIIQDLEARGLLFQAQKIPHKAALCSYCGSPVIDYAQNGWYARISQQQDELLKLNQQTINYSDWDHETFNVLDVEKFDDKVLSYDRYWGAPLPIWECQSCHHQICVGSIDELIKLAGNKQPNLDLHRPSIDDVILVCPECQGHLKRVTDLVHPWFESACMPFASWHYPFENQSLFEQQFPANLVCVDSSEIENWLVDLHVVNGMLFSKASFKGKLLYPSLIDTPEKGKEITRAEHCARVINEFGGDVFRWHLFDGWQPKERKLPSRNCFQEHSLSKAQKTISRLWFAYEFFVNRANLDDWSPLDIPKEPKYSLFDLWLRSALHELILDVTTDLDIYHPKGVVKSLHKFSRKLSNWYIPHLNYRLSHAEMDTEKIAAYATLYEALLTLCRLCAPVIPFSAEEMYQNLAGNDQSQSFISVHLADWPIADLTALDEPLMEEMEEVMKLASLGRVARQTANIPLYQPLAEISFITQINLRKQAFEAYCELLRHRLNVKTVKFLDSSNQVESNNTPSQYVLVTRGLNKAALMTQLTPDLVDEGIARQVIYQVRKLRKLAGLGFNEHIRLYIKSTPGLSEAIFRFRHIIASEALVDEMSEPPVEKTGLSQYEINGKPVVIGVEAIHS